MASGDTTSPATPKAKLSKEVLDALLQYTPTERAALIVKHKAERAAQSAGNSQQTADDKMSADKSASGNKPTSVNTHISTPVNHGNRFHSPSSDELSIVMSGALPALRGVSDVPEGLKRRYSLRQ